MCIYLHFPFLFMQELPMRKGDRVQLIQGGKYGHRFLKPGERGTYLSDPDSEKYEKRAVEFDNGYTVQIPVGNIQRIL